MLREVNAVTSSATATAMVQLPAKSAVPSGLVDEIRSTNPAGLPDEIRKSLHGRKIKEYLISKYKWLKQWCRCATISYLVSRGSSLGALFSSLVARGSWLVARFSWIVDGTLGALPYAVEDFGRCVVGLFWADRAFRAEHPLGCKVFGFRVWCLCL